MIELSSRDLGGMFIFLTCNSLRAELRGQVAEGILSAHGGWLVRRRAEKEMDSGDLEEGNVGTHLCKNSVQQVTSARGLPVWLQRAREGASWTGQGDPG